MAEWNPFTIEEQTALAAQNLSLTEVHLMVCPHCGKSAMRVYLHDLDDRRARTAEWVWCGACRRFAHYVVGGLSAKFSYDDPLDSAGFSGDKWYDHLSRLYDTGVLPQKITLLK